MRGRVTRFLQPEWFWLLALLPVVLLWRGRRGPVAAIEYSDVSLAREIARRGRSRIGWLLWLLPILAAALIIVGLARPQRAHGRTLITANGIDIVLGLDVSGSMQALDFEIDHQRVNRIEVVKSVVSKFIDERQDDRIGIIAFAGSPYLVSPITLDHDWLQQNLAPCRGGGRKGHGNQGVHHWSRRPRRCAYSSAGSIRQSAAGNGQSRCG